MESKSYSVSIDGRYSIGSSMMGVFKEDKNQNSLDKTLNENKDEVDEDEEMEELSDIEKYSENFDDDEDTYNIIGSYNEDKEDNEVSDININYEEDNEDYVVRKRKTRREIIECCYDLDEEEPPLYINIDEGLTQMVNKKIEKSIKLPYYINNEMIEVLMIAEKPSLAKKIALIISNNVFSTYHYEQITIYTFIKKFQGKKAFITVSSIRGHIYQDCFKDQDKYDTLDIKKLYDEEIVKILKIREDKEDKKKYKKEKYLNIPLFLRNIAKGKDILCLWLDCDPEGENICYEVIQNVYPNLNERNYQQIYRAKFNSLTEKDIKQAFDNLSDYPNKKLSMSVDARSIIDFKVGVCFTRLFSSEILPYIKKYQNIRTIMSYGPCQTPTLWFCVKRLKERRKYRPSSYYKIYIEIEDDNGETYRLYMNKVFDNKTDLQKRLNKIRFSFYVDLEKITYKKKIKNSPTGLKTTTMLKMASLQLGLSPYQTSKDAQKLYMNGLISYPRTKSTKYSENFDFENSLKMFRDNPHFSEKVNNLLDNFDKNDIDFSKGEEKGGHEPIIPTDSETQQNIREDLNWELYRCICLYYFASISPPLEYENIEYKFLLGKHKLKLTVSKLLKKGFLNFLPLKNKSFVEKLPSFEVNNHYKIVNIDYEKRYYSKPEYLTEAELISQMEKKHIGTDGSIPSHIRNLTSRGYVKVNEHRRIIPTKLGVTLIDALEKYVPGIVKPKNRARIEKFVKQIETGEKKFDEAIQVALEFYKKKLKRCNKKIKKIKDEFRKQFDLIDNED